MAWVSVKGSIRELGAYQTYLTTNPDKKGVHFTRLNNYTPVLDVALQKAVAGSGPRSLRVTISRAAHTASAHSASSVVPFNATFKFAAGQWNGASVTGPSHGPYSTGGIYQAIQVPAFSDTLTLTGAATHASPLTLSMYIDEHTSGPSPINRVDLQGSWTVGAVDAQYSDNLPTYTAPASGAATLPAGKDTPLDWEFANGYVPSGTTAWPRVSYAVSVEGTNWTWDGFHWQKWVSPTRYTVNAGSWSPLEYRDVSVATASLTPDTWETIDKNVPLVRFITLVAWQQIARQPISTEIIPGHAYKINTPATSAISLSVVGPPISNSVWDYHSSQHPNGFKSIEMIVWGYKSISSSPNSNRLSSYVRYVGDDGNVVKGVQWYIDSLLGRNPFVIVEFPAVITASSVHLEVMVPAGIWTTVPGTEIPVQPSGPSPYVVDQNTVKKAKSLYVVNGTAVPKVKELYVVDQNTVKKVK